jgi:hypothetical protein
MNRHIRGHHAGQGRAEARPVAHRMTGGRSILDEVVVACVHPDGRETIHLTPDEALAVQGRLSQLATVYLHGLTPAELPAADPASPSEAVTAHPVVRKTAGQPLVLEEVVVEIDRIAGRAIVHLSPEQVRDVEEQLTAIAVAYLHENTWGGEDARTQ